MQMNVEGFSLSSTYGEAFATLCEAIKLERAWVRMAVQPFNALFRGTGVFLENGGDLSSEQSDVLRNLTTEAIQKFPWDKEIQEEIGALREIL